MKKICVTGNNGFIGRAIQNKLEKLGYIVLGIDSWIFERAAWDVKLKDYIEKINPDAVFHVGACSNTRCNDLNKMMEWNVRSTIIISEYCKANKKPMIFSSSASIYGIDGNPNTLYSWSKFIGEKFVLANGGTALRYFNVYGCSEIHKGEMASVAFQAYQKYKWGEEVKLFPGNPTRDFIHVDDVVEANLKAWDNYNNCSGKYFDVGTGESRSFEDVLNLMDIKFNYHDKDAIPENYQFKTQANKSLFVPGWEPKYKIEEGIPYYKSMLKITTFFPL